MTKGNKKIAHLICIRCKKKLAIANNVKDFKKLDPLCTECMAFLLRMELERVEDLRKMEMKQGNFFSDDGEGPKARARNTDPETSHIAADDMNISGRAATQRALCLRVVREYPGKTSAEIAKFLGVDRYTPSRRLPELRHAGLVVNKERRICNVRGTLMMTWY